MGKHVFEIQEVWVTSVVLDQIQLTSQGSVVFQSTTSLYRLGRALCEVRVYRHTSPAVPDTRMICKLIRWLMSVAYGMGMLLAPRAVFCETSSCLGWDLCHQQPSKLSLWHFAALWSVALSFIGDTDAVLRLTFHEFARERQSERRVNDVFKAVLSKKGLLTRGTYNSQILF